MTSLLFNEYSLNDRVKFILRAGSYLNFIEYPNFELHLYSISDFFVEIKITKVGSDVESARVIQGEDVDKYLADISLPASV